MKKIVVIASVLVALLASAGTAQANVSVTRTAAHIASQPGVCKSLNQVVGERGYYRVEGAFIREYSEGMGEASGMPAAVPVFRQLVRDCS